MQNLFSIGEVASIFGETTETFRHYDRVGLLKPYLVKDSGYRYYSLDQFEMISTILHLRSIGTSIDRIKELLHSRSRGAIRDELFKQKEELGKQIEHLKYLEYQAKTLLDRFDSFQTEEIRLELEPRFYMLKQNFAVSQLAVDPRQLASFHKGIDPEWIKYSNIISIINKEAMEKGEYHKYCSYGILSEQDCHNPNEFYHTLEPREYVTGCIRITSFDHREIDGLYKKLMNFIHNKKLSIDGDSFERNLLDLYNEEGSGDIHYIKIYIPVKKPN